MIAIAIGSDLLMIRILINGTLHFSGLIIAMKISSIAVSTWIYFCQRDRRYARFLETIATTSVKSLCLSRYINQGLLDLVNNLGRHTEQDQLVRMHDLRPYPGCTNKAWPHGHDVDANPQMRPEGLAKDRLLLFACTRGLSVSAVSSGR